MLGGGGGGVTGLGNIYNTDLSNHHHSHEKKFNI